MCIVIVSIILLFLVLWKGKVVNNAQSWIFGIQPAEFIKLGVIIVLAVFFQSVKRCKNHIGKAVVKLFCF